MLFPAGFEMFAVAVGKASVVHYKASPTALFGQVKLDDRINAFRPPIRPPRLNNSMVWYKLDASPSYRAAETQEGPTGFAVDFGREARKGSELLGVQECFVDPRRTGLEVNFLMDGGGRVDCARLCRSSGLPSCACPGAGAHKPQAPKRDRSPGDDSPPRRRVTDRQNLQSLSLSHRCLHLLSPARLLAGAIESHHQNMINIMFFWTCGCVSSIIQYAIGKEENMPYPSGHREKVKERIIRSARKLFNRRGFESVSVNEIMAAAGLTRGGFYSYFESKSDLYAEVLACFFTDPDWKDCWEGVEIDRTAADFGAQIVRAYLSRQHFEDVDNSCPMVALPSDVARSGDAVKRAFETVFKAMVDVLERGMHLDRGSKDDRSLKSDSHRHQTAQAIAAICVGGMVLARSMEDRAVADDLRQASMTVALKLGGWGKGMLSKSEKSGQPT
jgi:TetR/AcrR family transcriptional repressor of nem operon